MGACTTASAPALARTSGALPVRVTRRWLTAGEREAPHRHDFLELCHIESGRGQLKVGSRTAVAPAHTLTVLPAGTIHALAADTGWACGANFLDFEATAVPAGAGALAVQGLCRLAAAGHASVYLRGSAGQALQRALGQVGALSRREDDEGVTACRQALADLCERLLRQVRDGRVATPAAAAPMGAAAPSPLSAATPAGARRQLEQVLAYIEANLQRPLSRQDLAREAAFAPSYFSAMFREATGSSIPDYLNARRVARAQELLRQPHDGRIEHDPPLGQ